MDAAAPATDRPRGEPAPVLGAGDVIEIRVFREPDLAGTYRINENGELEFPLIGKVNLRDKTAEQVATEIRTKLSQGYLRDPQVAVFVKEVNSRKIHVLGQVNRAGTFGFEPGMTVVQAVTNAGGFTKLASVNGVTVTRVVDGKEQTFKLKVGEITSGDAPNFELWPGDIIFVPESLF
ncbi:MAG: polysaccharide biosynthesis/export family protein [Deltaproteobacteria bacterium]|nr:polysaccharide biosynthesis/export family protein [Deltaproteobacteria bacterium]